MTSRSRSHQLERCGALGAAAGAIIGVLAVLLIFGFVGSFQHDNYWLLAGVEIGILSGGMTGFGLTEATIERRTKATRREQDQRGA